MNSLPLNISNAIEEALLFTASDEDAFREGKLDPVARVILIRQWEEFVYNYTLIKFDPYQHLTEEIDASQGDEIDYLAHDWVLSRVGAGAGLWDGRWGRFGDKLHKLALMQGQLETDYDEETKTLYLLSVRGDLSEGL